MQNWVSPVQLQLNWLCAKAISQAVEDEWRKANSAGLLLLSPNPEYRARCQAMNGQSCHVGLCQLDCLALDCGLTMSAEGAVRKHHMVMYMIYRSPTCSKDSSRGLIAHSWWLSLSRLVLPSILRGDWDQSNLSFLPRPGHKSKHSLCLEGELPSSSAFHSKWVWWSDKWLWCNLPWWSIFERDTCTHGPNASNASNASNVTPSSSSLAVCSIKWTFGVWRTSWFPWE